MRLALVLFACLAAACQDRADRLPEHELSGQTMGTTFSIKLVAPGAGIDRDELGRDVTRMLQQTNIRMSTYLPESELSMFNASQSTDWLEVSAELCDALEAALAVSRATDGAFDITVGPLVNLWGFGPGESRQEPPGNDEIAQTRKRVGFDKVSTDCSLPAVRKTLPDVYVDLSAFAKGYAVDRVAALLDERRLTDYLVEIGGELRMRGRNAAGERWAIAVEKPVTDARAVQSIVHLTDSAMATSGDYRNYFEFDGQRYSHAIDPGTGRPIRHNAAAVTVVSDTAAEADALATALLVLGPDKGLEYAREAGIAAYFLLRHDPGIEEKMTKEFADLLR